MTEKKTISILGLFEIAAIIVIAAFWLCYGVISRYQRFATDDYWLLSMVRERGVIGELIWGYFNWGGTLFCALFQNITFYLVRSSKSLLVYNLFLLIFVSSSTWFLLYELTLLLNFTIKPLHLFISSQFVVLALFFSGFNIPENWFWVTGATSYVYPLCFIFLSAVFLIRFKRRAKNADFIIACLFGFILGGNPIIYVIPFGFVVSLIFAIDFYRTKKIVLPNIIYLFILLGGAIANILAPGNFKRLNEIYLAHANDIRPSFIHELLVVPFIVLKLLLAKYVYLLIFSVPIAYLLVASGLNKHIPFRYIGWVFLCLMAAICINICVMYKIGVSGIGEDRIYLFINVMFILLIVLVATVFIQRPSLSKYMGPVSILLALAGIYFDHGNLIFILLVLLATVFIIQRTRINNIGPLSILLLILGIYIISQTFHREFPRTKQYARAEDERVATMLKAKSVYKQPILYLDKLPPSGIIYSAEITEDTSYWKNVRTRDYFELPFAIAIK